MGLREANVIFSSRATLNSLVMSGLVLLISLKPKLFTIVTLKIIP
jgi:hypothetical protein